MVEKCIREGICHSIYWYAKANDKYMKEHDENKGLSYLQYQNVNNLYGLAMSQKLPVSNCEWIADTSQFNKDFIKNYNDEIDKGYFVDVQYREKLHERHNDLSFLPGTMKFEKVNKLVTILYDKIEDVIHIRNLKQGLNHGLVLRKVHIII